MEAQRSVGSRVLQCLGPLRTDQLWPQSSMSSQKTTRTLNLCFKQAGLVEAVLSRDLGQATSFSGINEAASQLVAVVLEGYSQSTALCRRVNTLYSGNREQGRIRSISIWLAGLIKRSVRATTEYF